jgi:16S rRNA processing protein RimM
MLNKANNIHSKPTQKVGVVLKSHGYKGHLKFQCDFDIEDDFLLLEINQKFVPFEIEGINPQGSIIKLKGIDSETEASCLSGLSILAFSDEIERDELDFEGYTLVDLLTNTSYVITNVELIPNNILLEFRNGFKDCLLPFSDGIIVSIDHDTQTIQANFPDGILDL